MNTTEKTSNTKKHGASSITEGAIWKTLLLFAFPIMLGTFFQQLYNTTDAVIVGRFVGKEALAAVGGSSGNLTGLLLNFFVGLSSGATVLIAQLFGAGQLDRVRKTIQTALLFSLICGLIMSAAGLVSAKTLLRLMHTPEEIMADSFLYLKIFLIGLPVNLLYNMGAGILRALGDSKGPFLCLAATCFVNVLLDLLFVPVLNMGVAGAAFATLLSQTFSAVLVIRALMKRQDVPLKPEPRTPGLPSSDTMPHLTVIRQIIAIGLPAGLQSIMYSVSNIIVQTAINAEGTTAVAAWTAYSKLDSMEWMIVSALGIALTTFVGQNYGAGNLKRVQRGVMVGMGMALIVALSLSAILCGGGPVFYRLFTTDPEVCQIGLQILYLLTPLYFLYTFIEIYSAALRGVGDCWIPMIMTACGVCVLRVCWVLMVPRFCPGLIPILANYPVTWLITTIAFLIYYYRFSPLRRRKGE